METKKPTVLIIMDGWGIAPPSAGNAITSAKLPIYNGLLKKYAWTELRAAGKAVGLPSGQDGNSEAGHMNIGAGRVVEQDAVVISKSIDHGTFFRNPAFTSAIAHARKNNSDVHLVGMITANQSAHSDPDHLISLIILLSRSKVKNIYLHLFTDGRDSPKYLAQKIMESFKGFFNNYVKVATVMGRFYGMDRKKEWSRTELAYNAMVLGEGIHEHSAQDAVLHAYARGESDEFIKPTVIVDDHDMPQGLIKDNDAVIFFNLRSDRARQMCKPFVQPDFEKLNPGCFTRRSKPKNLFMVAMTDFGPDLGDLITAFPSRELADSLPMVLHDFRQLAIAENEKYAHVTYFFNGGYADPVANEKRVIVKSPDLKTYDDVPQMSLDEVTRIVVEGIDKERYDFITVNVANPDMIAHTGNLAATIKACEYTDSALGSIIDATMKKDGMVIVTADHGNAEEVINIETGEVDTEHSANHVPFIIVKKGPLPKLRPLGKLADIAPTILELLGVPKPKLMTGRSLIEK